MTPIEELMPDLFTLAQMSDILPTSDVEELFRHVSRTIEMMESGIESCRLNLSITTAEFKGMLDNLAKLATVKGGLQNMLANRT